MTEIIGYVYCHKEMCTWEVWTNGRAYSDAVGVEGTPICAYRDQTGAWMTTLMPQRGRKVKASEAIEEAFSKAIGSIVVGASFARRK